MTPALFFLERAWDLTLVLFLLAAACGSGGELLGRIPDDRLTPAEELLFGTTLGLGVLGLVFLALGAVGLLEPAAFAVVLIGAVLVGRRHVYAAPGRLAQSVGALRRSGTVAGPVAVGVLLLAGLVLLMAGAAPVTDWDALMYHLDIPVELLEAGRIHLPEDNLHVARVGLVHMLYLPLLALGGGSGPSFLSGVLALFLGLALYGLGARLFTALAGAVAATLLWGSSIVVLVAATPRVDVSVALFLFLAHYALLVHLDDEDHGTWGLVLASALAGLAVGVKASALGYVAPLGLLGLWIAARRREGRGPALARLVGLCTAVFALVSLPWLVKNVALVGAPLYPLLSERILPPWLAAVAGSRVPPSGAGPEIWWVLGQARRSFSLVELFVRPENLTVEVEARSYATNPAFLILPLTVLFVRSRRLMALVLPPLAYLLLVLLPFDFTNLRYLIPVIPALTLSSAEVGRRLFERIGHRTVVEGGLVALALLALIPSVRALGHDVVTTERLRVVLGFTPPGDYLARSSEPGFPAYWNARTRTQEVTDPDDRILLLFEARGLYFDRDVLQDNVLANWPLLRATGVTADCLAETGITHVLVNHGVLAYYRRRGLDTDDIKWGDFAPFARRCLNPVFRGGGYTLYAVEGGTREPAQ